MVAVVVDDAHAVPGPHLGEAALDAAEIGERLADEVVGNTERVRHRHGRRRIERVVAAGHRQRELVDRVRDLAVAAAELHGKARSAVVMVEIAKPHVGLRIARRR